MNWVRTRDYSGNTEIRKFSNNQAFSEGYYKEVQEWIPNKSEWCWFGLELVQVIEVSSNVVTISRDKPEIYEKVNISDLEPFTKQLPSGINKLKG